MTSNRINVGIVGLGRWAKVLTRAARQSDLLAITSGYSRSQEKRSAFQDEFGIAAAPDLATMLADPGITGVIITVPNEQHLAVAREVAKAGKHVYTEKPITTTVAEGRELLAEEGEVAGDHRSQIDEDRGLARREAREELPQRFCGEDQIVHGSSGWRSGFERY